MNNIKLIILTLPIYLMQHFFIKNAILLNKQKKKIFH